MSSSRRTALLLALLLGLGGYYLWTQVSGGASSAGFVASRGAGVSRAQRSRTVEVEVLATDRLEQKPGVYQHGRDLFSYGQPEREQHQPRRQPPRPQPKPVEQPAQPPAATEPPKPEPPRIDVAYLGSFGRPGRRIAVFSDSENVYNALVGDVVKEKFVLVAVGYESADLGFVGFPEVSPRRLAAGRMR